MTAVWHPFVAVMRNEFRMQWRRRAMWLVMIAASGVLPLLAWNTLNQRFEQDTVAGAVADWASYLNHTGPFGCAMVLANRLPRDRRLQVDELLDSFPAGLGTRLWGKALGAVAASIIPFLLIALAGVVYIAAHLHAARAIPIGVAAILTINLPALLFISALCILLSAVIWTPAVGFVCAFVWSWVQLDPTQNPAPGNSLFSPYGDYAIVGLFGSHRGAAGARGQVNFGPLSPAVSVTTGLLSVLLIVAVAAVLQGAVPSIARRRQRR
jgi:hypothetical protein